MTEKPKLVLCPALVQSKRKWRDTPMRTGKGSMDEHVTWDTYTCCSMLHLRSSFLQATYRSHTRSMMWQPHAMTSLNNTSLKASKPQQPKPSRSYWVASKQPPIAPESKEERKEKRVLFNRMFLLHEETVHYSAMHIHSGECRWHERGTVCLVFYYSKYTRCLSKWTDTRNNQTVLSSQNT